MIWLGTEIDRKTYTNTALGFKEVSGYIWNPLGQGSLSRIGFNEYDVVTRQAIRLQIIAEYYMYEAKKKYKTITI